MKIKLTESQFNKLKEHSFFTDKNGFDFKEENPINPQAHSNEGWDDKVCGGCGNPMAGLDGDMSWCKDCQDHPEPMTRREYHDEHGLDDNGEQHNVDAGSAMFYEQLNKIKKIMGQLDK